MHLSISEGERNPSVIKRELTLGRNPIRDKLAMYHNRKGNHTVM